MAEGRWPRRPAPHPPTLKRAGRSSWDAQSTPCPCLPPLSQPHSLRVPGDHPEVNYVQLSLTTFASRGNLDEDISPFGPSSLASQNLTWTRIPKHRDGRADTKLKTHPNRARTRGSFGCEAQILGGPGKILRKPVSNGQD